VFWSWIAIAVLALIVALLTGRLTPLMIGGGASLAAAAAHLAWPGAIQWLLCAAGFVVGGAVAWHSSRR
jgi:hypothetical protein